MGKSKNRRNWAWHPSSASGELGRDCDGKSAQTPEAIKWKVSWRDSLHNTLQESLTTGRQQVILDFISCFDKASSVLTSSDLSSSCCTLVTRYEQALKAYMTSKFSRFAAFQNEFSWLSYGFPAYLDHDYEKIWTLLSNTSEEQSLERYFDGVKRRRNTAGARRIIYDRYLIMWNWWKENGKGPFEFYNLPTEIRGEVFQWCIPERKTEVEIRTLDEIHIPATFFSRFLKWGYGSLVRLSNPLRSEVFSTMLATHTWIAHEQKDILRMHELFHGYSVRPVVTLELEFRFLLKPGAVFPPECFEAISSLPLKRVIIRLPPPTTWVYSEFEFQRDLADLLEKSAPQTCYNVRFLWVLEAVYPLVRDVPIVEVIGSTSNEQRNAFMHLIEQHRRTSYKCQKIEKQHFQHKKQEDTQDGGVSLGSAGKHKKKGKKSVFGRSGVPAVNPGVRYEEDLLNDYISGKINRCECIPRCTPIQVWSLL